MNHTFRLTLLAACVIVGLLFAIAAAALSRPEISSTLADSQVTSPPLLPETQPQRATYSPAAASAVNPQETANSQLLAGLLEIIKTQSQTPPPEPPTVVVHQAPAEKDSSAPVVPATETLPATSAKPVDTETANRPIVERNAGDDRLRMVFQDSEIRDVLELLSRQGGLNILAGRSVTGTVSGTLNDVDVESALEAVLKSSGFTARREGRFVYVGTPEDFQQIDQSFDELATRVYRPNYVSGTDLQTLITPLLTPTVGKITISTASQVDLPSSQTATGGDGLSQNDVVIVRDYEAVLMQFDELVSEIDKRPRQVSIEAMILSVKLSDQNKTGIDFQALKNQGNVKLGTGSPPASLGGVTFTDGGLKFGFLDGSMTSLISALETVGETNVVAAPRITCLNKQRAEIQIGEQLGYVSTTVNQTSTTQSVEFLDVGTLLRLRPFISSDGTIRMEVHPELSTGAVTVSSGLTLPNKEVTQVTTNIMCRDGSTAILGGLIREDLTNDTNQLPILGNVPFVGALFRRKSEKIDRREIVVLITPRLIDDPEMNDESTSLGSEFLRRQSVFFDKMSPAGRRSAGQRYLRLARSAWNAEDAENALKFVNRSIHLDPMSRESVALRDEIVAKAFPNEPIEDYLKQGLYFWDRPDIDHSKNGVDWKADERLSSGGPSPQAYDSGTPGGSVTLRRPPPAQESSRFREKSSENRFDSSLRYLPPAGGS